MHGRGEYRITSRRLVSKGAADAGLTSAVREKRRGRVDVVRSSMAADIPNRES